MRRERVEMKLSSSMGDEKRRGSRMPPCEDVSSWDHSRGSMVVRKVLMAASLIWVLVSGRREQEMDVWTDCDE